MHFFSQCASQNEKFNRYICKHIQSVEGLIAQINIVHFTQSLITLNSPGNYVSVVTFVVTLTPLIERSAEEQLENAQH